MRSPVYRKSQHGAVAIEFAVLFGIFFAILYAIIAYSLPLLLMLTFKQVAADAARAAIAVDPAAGEYAVLLEERVKSVVEGDEDGSWIRHTDWYAPCPGYDGFSKRPEGSNTLTVCIDYKTDNYNNDPIIPPLPSLPGIGTIPRLPNSIQGSSTIRL